MRKNQILLTGLIALLLFAFNSPPTGALPTNVAKSITLRPGETRHVIMYDYETLVIYASTKVTTSHRSIKTDRWVTEQIDRLSGRWILINDHHCAADLPDCRIPVPMMYPNPMGPYYLTPAMCGGGVREIVITADP